MATINKTRLAITFCKLLKVACGDNFSEVIALNGTDEFPLNGACPSHEFCDANQVMIDALSTFGVEYTGCESDLTDAAWTIAREYGYSARAISGLNVPDLR